MNNEFSLVFKVSDMTSSRYAGTWGAGELESCSSSLLQTRARGAKDDFEKFEGVGRVLRNRI